MDRGFEAMIPQPKKEVPKEKTVYDYKTELNLLGKRLTFIIKVQNNRRTK